MEKLGREQACEKEIQWHTTKYQLTQRKAVIKGYTVYNRGDNGKYSRKEERKVKSGIECGVYLKRRK